MTEELLTRTVWQVGPIRVNGDTMVMTWIAMAIIMAFAILASRKLEAGKGAMLTLTELLFEFVDGLMGKSRSARPFFPWIMTLFLFILISNLLSVIPTLTSPTSDPNVTLGLALIALGLTAAAGIRVKGFWGYIRSFATPYPFFLPVHLVETATRALTLAFRLFGNMFAGEMLVTILTQLMAFVLPIFAEAFHIFIAVLQAYIFVSLTIAYILDAADEEGAR